jgi:hypothetical protein
MSLGSVCAVANPHDNAQPTAVIRMIRIARLRLADRTNRLVPLQFHAVYANDQTARKRCPSWVMSVDFRLASRMSGLPPIAAVMLITALFRGEPKSNIQSAKSPCAQAAITAIGRIDEVACPRAVLAHGCTLP